MKNKSRIFFITLLSLLTVVASTGLIACSVDDVIDISVTPEEVSVRIGEFDYGDYTVTATYGSGKKKEETLSENMIGAGDRLKLMKEGEHEITVSYMNKTATMKVNVRRNVFESATFEDIDAVYTGDFYVVEVKNVPEGTTVTYPTTNRFRNAGEYEATAVLRKDAFEIKEMKAKVVIRKADYDLSSVTFEDKTETYDGSVHELAIAGKIPSGVYVDYTITRDGGKEEKGNGARNAGSYTVTASFSGDVNNYNRIEPKEAVLTIRQAVLDTSAITFSDKTEVYDRTRHSLKIGGTLPTGVSVDYDNNEHVDAGVYEATAVFTVADSVNYAPIPDKKAVLTIEKADYDMSDVHYNGNRFFYDGSEKKIEIQGALPNGVRVSYSDNVGVDAGTYQAVASFTVTDKNYNEPKPITATLIIDPVEAQMDEVVFERSRFISVQKPVFSDDYDDDFDDETDYDEDYIRAKQYNPYYAAMQYRPANVPLGLAVKEVQYYKTDGWVEDLTVFHDDGDYKYSDEITEDGYYVVVVLFEENANYTSVSPARTQIRTTTIAQFTTSDVIVYDPAWRDPVSKSTVSAYFDYYYGSCVPVSREVMLDELYQDYCDCNIFKTFGAGGENAIIRKYDADIADSVINAYNEIGRLASIAIEYYNASFGAVGFAKPLALSVYKNSYEQLLPAASTASVGQSKYAESFEFNKDKADFLRIEGDSVVSYNSIAYEIQSDDSATYKTLLATLFGYTDETEFINDAQGVVSALIGNKAGANTNTSADRGRYAGSVLTQYESNRVFVFPFGYSWLEKESGNMNRFFVYVLVDDVADGGEISFLINDLDLAKQCVALRSTGGSVNVYGRCQLAEREGWKWSPKTVTITENGVETVKYLTNGSELSFIKGVDNFEGIEDDRIVFKFRSELPGRCSEETDGYDKNKYTVDTGNSAVTFCDCNPLGTVLKGGGDASNISKREAREDHAQMSDDFIARFDALSAYYNAFIINYDLSDVVSNEWRVGLGSRYYTAYREYFDCAKELFSGAGRNMGINTEYLASDSAIIGMNKAFAISVGGATTYSVDAYRAMVMKLFGFTDIDTFTAYSEALASALSQNEKRASSEFASTRLLYDGAIYTESGYFVIPYAIKSDLSEKNVLALVFVDRSGNMSIWINNARNAFAAVDFPTGEKTGVGIYGRCMLFEDDGFMMLEMLDPAVREKIEELKGYNPFVDAAVDEEETPPIAIERIKNITGAGDYLVYITLRDSEGFKVKLNSVYGYDIEGNCIDGFYTVVTVVLLDDLKTRNRAINDEA